MRALLAAVVTLSAAACQHTHGVAPPPEHPMVSKDGDPIGLHQQAISQLVKPFIDGEVVTAMVIGVYDNGKPEIYGFGTGPNNKPPNGRSLFEIGSITKVFTSLMLADAVQRKEIELEQPLSDFLPPGVTSPTKDGKTITLKLLALHSSGLPRLPPSIAAAGEQADPYGKYDENRLYNDLTATALDTPPGTQVVYSNYGSGVLGFVLGKKLGGGFAAALNARVLKPLDLRDTTIDIPPKEQGRVVRGTNDDLKPTAPWTWDALAGAGALHSDAHDLLELAVDELDASEGGERPLVRAMKLSQEPQLEHEGDNEGLGWMIDPGGRYWHNGATGGYHSFVGFDPKTRRAVVILSATQITPIDHLADLLYSVLDGKDVTPPKFPTADNFATFIGSYDFTGTKIDIIADGKRLYIQGPGEPRHRLVPLSDHEFWIEELQGIAVFERDSQGNIIVVFVVGGQRITATRIGPSPPEARPPPVPVSPVLPKTP
jgi:CubicO group peptidase (beta-lactamase class C family)